jgi:glycerophosphoryl diester phosphodiesterase
MPKQLCFSFAPSLRQGEGQQGTLSCPLVMGHGGAAFSMPEHTLESYQLAFDLGANYVEPDFYPTKEGRLIARHDIDLSTTTNVAQLFPNRSRTLTLSGVSYYSSVQ